MSESNERISGGLVIIAVVVGLLTYACIQACIGEDASSRAGRSTSIIAGLAVAGFIAAIGRLLKRISKAGTKPQEKESKDDNDHFKDDEDSTCLECGTAITGGKTKCPSCGWSYCES